eukprot:3621621-Alexandrium_andersonii.AAC.1
MSPPRWPSSRSMSCSTGRTRSSRRSWTSGSSTGASGCSGRPTQSLPWPTRSVAVRSAGLPLERHGRPACRRAAA